MTKEASKPNVELSDEINSFLAVARSTMMKTIETPLEFISYYGAKVESDTIGSFIRYIEKYGRATDDTQMVEEVLHAKGLYQGYKAHIAPILDN